MNVLLCECSVFVACVQCSFTEQSPVDEHTYSTAVMCVCYACMLCVYVMYVCCVCMLCMYVVCVGYTCMLCVYVVCVYVVFAAAFSAAVMRLSSESKLLSCPAFLFFYDTLS